MAIHGSITLWLGKLQQGDEAAAQAIWDRYFSDLLRLARRKLAGQQGRTAGMGDEEDVVLNALNSFFRGAARHAFADVTNRVDLWRLLSVLTWRKAVDVVRRNQCRPLAGESALAGGRSARRGIEHVPGNELSPEIIATVNEEIGRLLGLLDDGLQDIALKRLQGFKNREIANACHCSLATVERRLLLIRRIWQRESEERL